ncbi:MAG: translation elongation factor Ts [bacterium]|nr:translation elongation factor Ts [bacterium]
MSVSAQTVKELRDKTGAGMMDCKKALAECAGDMEKAIDFLRKKGLKDVGKRSGKVAAEGVIYSYIHGGGRIGVMLELNCETDFVARGDDFQELAKLIAMHVAWANPRFISREDVTADVIEREKDIFRAQLKPGQEAMAEKILTGRLDKFYQENCLLEQLDAKDANAKKRIGDLVNEVSAKVGEKITLRRMSRYEVGEGIEKVVANYAEEVAAAAGLN